MGIDCGGSVCGACCPHGPSDCTSLVCTRGACQPATCTDGVQNGAETGLDCGGTCAPCPTVVLLAGGAPGPNGVLAGVFIGSALT